jgi:hypothetical protein
MIFGIGLPKTGTSTLTKALNILGYNCIHDWKRVNIQISRNRLIKNKLLLDGLTDKYNAFTDDPIPPNFLTLDKQYPNSKFILTIRDIESWLVSRKKHRAIYLPNLKTNSYEERIFYKNFMASVKNHFKDRPDDLLIMNIIEGEGWEPLCRFLDKHIPNCQFPWENKSIS